MRVRQANGRLQLAQKRRMHLTAQCSDWVPRRHELTEQAGEGIAKRSLRFRWRRRINDLRTVVSPIEIAVIRQMKVRQCVVAAEVQMHHLAPGVLERKHPEGE